MQDAHLFFNQTADTASAILYTWWLGTEAGNAIADVLFGDYNPSGKLPMTFPREEGQLPIYYNHFNTGRPAPNETASTYVSAYTDLKNSPKFPFGYGLSYTTFDYTDLKLSKNKINDAEIIEVSFNLINSGKFEGNEVVQLYLRDKVGSVVRPIIELKDFQKIHLNAGETKTIQFTIDKEKLSFYNQQLEWGTEPGDFDLMIGSSSSDIRLRATFELIK
jgi:beta-glucosidase